MSSTPPGLSGNSSIGSKITGRLAMFPSPTAVGAERITTVPKVSTKSPTVSADGPRCP